MKSSTAETWLPRSLFMAMSGPLLLLLLLLQPALGHKFHTITPVFPFNSSRLALCDPEYPYRTNDGSCNNLQHPTWAMSAQVFFRPEILNGFVDQRTQMVKSPERPINDSCGTGSWNGPVYRENTRCISNLMETTGNDPLDERGLSQFAINLGQIIMHDMVQNEQLCVGGDIPCFELNSFLEPIHPPDRFLPPGPDQKPYIFINPTVLGVDEYGITGAINFVSGWMDLSTLYGKDDDTVNGFRSFVGGKLKALKDDPSFPPRLTETKTNRDFISWPFSQNTTFGCGDQRGYANVVLGALTTILFREHQRLAEEFQGKNPTWDDERLFQEARKINIAQWQQIVYYEYLPVLLGPQALLIPPYSGYNPKINGQASVSFANGAFRTGHSALADFAEVVGSEGETLKVTSSGLMGGILSNGFFSVINFYKRYGVEGPILGALRNPAYKIDHLVPDGLRIIQPGGTLGAGIDIIAQGLHRGRISGALDYNTARIRWGVPSLYDLEGCSSTSEEIDSLTCFLLLNPDKELMSRVRNYYRKVNNIDLEFGIALETKEPGSTFGPVGGRIIADQFSRVRDGDRFWFENPDAFTPEELASIRKVTLADLLKRNSNLTDEQLGKIYFI